MSVPDEVRRDAEKTAELVRKKLMENHGFAGGH